MLGFSLPGHQDYLSKMKAMFVHGNAMTIFILHGHVCVLIIVCTF